MFSRISLLIVLVVLAGCGSRVSRCESQVKSYRHGDAACTEEKEFPIGAFTENSDSARLYLDRGVIRLQQGDAEGSLLDFLSAIDAIEFYRKMLAQETAVQILTSDELSPYIAKYYEALYARIYAAFACYALGQEDNAFALLKQAVVLEDLHNEMERCNERSPLLSYLMEMHVERAKKSYNATLVLLVHHGLIPEKKSVIAPASIVSAAAVEALLMGLNIPPAISSLTGIAIPAFPNKRPLNPPYGFDINGNHYVPEKIEDMFGLAKADLEGEMPKIAAKAAARQLIRRAAVGTVREKSPLAGDLTDLFFFVANMVTHADTRMWKTLPRELYLLRLDLPPGLYRIGSESITLQSGQLYIHQVFSKEKSK